MKNFYSILIVAVAFGLTTCNNKIEVNVKNDNCQVFFSNFNVDLLSINTTCSTLDNQVLNNVTIFGLTAEIKTSCLPDSGVIIELERYSKDGTRTTFNTFVQSNNYDFLKVYPNRIETTFCANFTNVADYIKVNMYVNNRNRKSNKVSVVINKPKNAL
ncbi:MAG: hypothetical protein SNJ77_01905 [Cytophagales bacterium]